MTAFWVFLALLVGAVACRVAWTRGQRSEDAKWVERMKDARQRGRETGRQEEQDYQRTAAEHAEAARQATMTENRRRGQLNRHAKAQRAARGES